MKILIIGVGTPISKTPPGDEAFYLKRKRLLDGQDYYYFKKEIINYEGQIQSLLAAGIDVIYGYVENVKSPLHLVKFGKQIRKITKEQHVTISHILWGNILSLVISMASSAPTVISLRGSDLLGSYNKHMQKTIKGKIAGLFSQLASFFSAKVLVESQHMKDSLWPVSRKKAIIFPNGVNPEKFYVIDKIQAREKLEWDLNKPIVIFFYHPRQYVKNEPLALETYEKLKARMPDCELKVLAHMPQEQLIYCYNAADAMLLASKHEGSNNSIKEAICCNLPVVSTPCGDGPERLPQIKNCYVSKKWDASELCDLLYGILTKRERSNGREHIADISTSAVQRKLIEIYKDLSNK